MRWKPTAAALLLAATLALTPTAIHAEDDDAWKFRWDNTFKLDSPDGRFKLQLGGRFMLDATFADADARIERAVGAVEDGTEVRRARLYVSGTLYDKVEFKAQYDFAGGDAEVRNLYVGLKDTPIGGVRLGHFKEPFSLEEITSSKYITFVERSLPSVFWPSYNTGIMVHDRGERHGWAVGAFRESDGFATSSGDGVLNLTGRVTGVPLHCDDDDSDASRHCAGDGEFHAVHLGLSVSQKDLGDGRFRFRQRPEAHQTPRFVDTGSFFADEVLVWSLELATVWDSFWAAAELSGADVDSAGLRDPSLEGYYVQAGYFLTGQHRSYRTGSGSFHRLDLSDDEAFGTGGKGAWEIAVRYSTLDLDDGRLRGGEIDDYSLALNWYLNSVTRFMLNFVHSEVRDVGEADFVLLRFQVEF